MKVLFLHHNNDPVTLRNWQQLQNQHPNCEAIWYNSLAPTGKGMDGSTKVEQGPHIVIDHLIKEFRDRIYYNWFLQRTPVEDFYVLAEWDTYCTMPVADFYAACDPTLDIVTCNLRLPSDSLSWKYFNQTNWMPELIRPYVTGFDPLCMTRLSHNAMVQLANYKTQLPGWCELRMATTAKQLGLKMGVIPGGRATVVASPGVSAVDGNGIFHPVKG